MRSLHQNITSQPIRNLATAPRATRYVNSNGTGFGSDRWAANTAYSLVTGASDGPPGLGISTYARGTVTTARNGLGFHLAQNPESTTPGTTDRLTTATPGATYTARHWFRCSVPVTVSVKIRFAPDADSWSGIAYVQATVVPAGTWTLVTASTVVPAGAKLASSMSSVNDTLNVGATFDGTGLELYDGPAPAGYCDGNSYGWLWAGGSVDNGPSVGYPSSPHLVRNLVQNPGLHGGSLAGWSRFHTGGTFVNTSESGGPWRGWYMRATCTVGGAGVTGGNYVLGRPSSGRPIHVVAGKTYTGSMWVRQSVAHTRALSIEWYDRSETKVGATSPINTTAPAAGVWTRMSGSATAPAGAVYAVLTMYAANVTVTAGETLDTTAAMLTEGTTLHAYCDGDTPGWRWLSTPGASMSEGYPYTLEGVAGGAPSVTRTSNGAQQMGGRTDQMGGLSLYAVYDVTNQDSAYGAIAWAGAPTLHADGRLTMQTGNAGSTALNPRYDTKGGANNMSHAINNSRTNGRHVLSMRARTGMAVYSSRRDAVTSTVSGEFRTSNMTPGEGIPGDFVGMGSTAGIVTALVLGFNRDIDDDTDLAIHRWLANAYGIPI